MLCRDVIAVYCDIQTKRLNALRGQDVELLSVKPDGTYSRPSTGLQEVERCRWILCQERNGYNC